MKRRIKIKGRKDSGSFLALPHHMLNSDEYCQLSSFAMRLLIDISAQYKGSNNGDLCCTWSLMELRKWKSRDTLHRAQCELENAGFIMRTRQGGRNSPNLFAITWRGIDECKGKLDVRENPVPANTWKKS